ncbi:MAG TPA: hypothetical protein VGJ22_00520 [Anaerolineales bacterium]|jgi:hypothetical protein
MTKANHTTRRTIRAALKKIRLGLAAQAAVIGLLAVVGLVVATGAAAARFGGSWSEFGAPTPNSVPATLAPAVPTCALEDPVAVPAVSLGRALYILFDGSNSYRLHTQWALDTMTGVLEATIMPDDRLSISWIGRDSADPANTFCCDLPVPQVALPVLPQVPALPVLEALIPANPELSSVAETQRKQHNALITARNSRKQEDYQCAMARRNDEALLLLDTWHSEQTAAVDEFWRAVEPSFTPGRRDSVTNIREAIYRASTVLQEDKKRSPRYLIILSDMVETEKSNFANVSPDLSGVTVLVTLTCTRAADCESLKSHWTGLFEQWSAKNVIYIQDAYPEEQLIDLLRKELK